MNASSNLTVDLIMGITLAAPPPVLSSDLIKPFDAKDASAQDVFTDQDKFEPSIVPIPVFAQPDWNPAPHPTGVSGDDKALWSKAQKAWQNGEDLGVGASAGKVWGLKDVAEFWKGAILWKKGASPEFPTSFVHDIESYYMSAPFISV